MKIINTTCRDVMLVDITGDEVNIKPNPERVAYIKYKYNLYKETIEGIQVVSRTFKELINMPKREDNTIFIVYRDILEMFPDRDDIFAVSLSYELERLHASRD